MTELFDEQTRRDFAAQRAAIAEAQAAADAFAQKQLDPAVYRLAELQKAQARLGSEPTPDAFDSARQWTTARDAHIFAASRYARDIAAAEQRVDSLREEHTRLAAVVTPLREAYWRAVLLALHAAAEAQTREAARMATLHKSMLMRLPQSQGHLGQTEGQPVYRVDSTGFSDISKFVATVVGNGTGPDKSAALAAELGL